MKRFVLPVAALSLPILLGGCLSIPLVSLGLNKLNERKERKEQEQVEQTAIVYAPMAGSIYRQDGVGQLNIYGDRRARNVGDLLTIVLEETTSAKTDAATTTSKNSTMDMAAPTIAGKGVTLRGRNLLENQVDASRDFDGSGKSSQSNTLSGNLTVTVIRRLGNGNLVIRGEKNLSLNQGNEYIRVEGVVRDADISNENKVSSSLIADARITYRGRGPLAQSNTPGPLAKFFQSSAYPY
ncbi:flagellar basal body L-ring protein FlgH [Pseudoxanthomonas sp.]|uniref:flagellar basal body L-ring protein FlgH n=1 Tax=Pseudoxanthomonas sp. TaxID=1871049 RepID=UPI0026030949|nr:flagellar basal body L-ring protein FlgH [Pseudoxanthomonas sp.]WDS36849.1 MAG: flagellar basal body L-ring protein FlgH [Pseudoxanthomonas sp.]